MPNGTEFSRSDGGSMVSFLEEIVNIDSESGDKEGNDRVLVRMDEELRALGFTTRRVGGGRFAASLYAERGCGRNDIVLLGHADTVFPAGTAGERPFHVDPEGLRAFGPGVLDMKGGLAILVFALRLLRQIRGGDALPPGLRVFVNADEEPGSPESRRYMAECAQGSMCALLLEPPDRDEQLVLERKGIGVFHVSAAGKAAHAGDGPRAGANAVHTLIRVANALIGLENESAGTSVNVGVIRGGDNPSIIPSSASAEVDVRVSVAEEVDRVSAEVARIAAAEWNPGTRVEIGGGFHRPPMRAVCGTRELLEAVAAAGASRGIPVSFQNAICGGASDGNLMTALGIPCIDGFGAVGGGAHTDQEWIDVASLERRVRLLASTLEQLLQRRDEGWDGNGGRDGA